MRNEGFSRARAQRRYRQSSGEQELPHINLKLILAVLLVGCVAVLKFMPDNGVQTTVQSVLGTTTDFKGLYADMKHVIASYTLGAPVFHMPLDGAVMSPYGERMNPITNENSLHTGMDIDAKEGTKVHAPLAGTVTEIKEDETYGKCMLVTHENGYATFYGHLSETLKEANAQIQQGEEIALSGNTGKSTGPHLHFEIRVDGTPIDPQPYLIK